jgi:hypothetical protein
MAGPMGWFVYESDDGNSYQVKQDASNAAAAGNAAAGTEPSLPHGYIPRYVLIKHPTTAKERRLMIGDPANAMFVGSDSTVTVEEFSGTHSAAVEHNIQGRVGERRYKR